MKKRWKAAESWDETLGELTMSAFGMLCYLKLQSLERREAPTTNDLYERLPLSVRTIDGTMGELKRAGLVQQA
jgi:DNA-binding IscR family transcriptional regulator